MSVGNLLTVCSAFDRVACQYPNFEAVVDSISRLTFGELDQASRRCVSALRSVGVAPGARVALLTQPSTVHLVTWLAVVRLGAIPVVLHTREAADVQGQLCAKIGIDTLLYDVSLAGTVAAIVKQRATPLTTIALRSAAAESGDELVTGMEIPRDLADFRPAQDLSVPAEDDLAVIILSSGTTSLPKGVMHSHRALIESARTSFGLYAGLRPGQRVIVPYSTAFTASYATWLPFLNAGGCSVFLEKFELPLYQAAIRREGVTHMSLTPTMWRKLLTLDAQSDTYRSVAVAQFAAEPMDSTTLERIRDTVARTVVQAYGSTETLAFATVNIAEDMTGGRLLSVGRPFANVEVRVIERGGGIDEILSADAVGEVIVSSPHLAQGIWDDDAMSAKLFPVDADGRRWWRSSDLGRLDEEGFLYLEGRSDDMIISGGINIMPAAIEEVLMSHPGVIDVAVVGLPNPEWGQEVHAFVVANDGMLTSEELSRFLKASPLSGYQRPRVIHFVESLPRNATNKLNRRALRESTPEGKSDA